MANRPGGTDHRLLIGKYNKGHNSGNDKKTDFESTSVEDLSRKLMHFQTPLSGASQSTS